MSVVTVLLVIAVVLWFLAAINWPPAPISLGWLGMFFWGLTMLFR